MATALAGHSGKVQINGTPPSTIALVTQWNGTLTEAMYDQTALGDNWTSDVPGVYTLTGTLTGKWDVAADAGQTTLHNALLGGTTVGLDLFVDNGTNGYEGTFRITDFATTVSATATVDFTCNFRSQGQVFFI